MLGAEKGGSCFSVGGPPCPWVRSTDLTNNSQPGAALPLISQSGRLGTKTSRNLPNMHHVAACDRDQVGAADAPRVPLLGHTSV